jgi:hypothetical protein
MRRLSVVIFLAGTSFFVLHARSVRPDPAQHQPSGRSSYDPMARGNGTGQPKGIVETTLAGVNPKDTDYGVVVADWRKEVFENTLHEIYFWAVIGLTMMLGTSVIGNGWLLRQREQRLAITADITTQIYNAYVTARARAFDVISRHNKLVERYNRLEDEAAELRARATVDVQPEPAQSADFDDARGAKSAEFSIPTDPRLSNTESAEAKEDEAELQGKLEELETKLRRKEAQLQAKDNQITNLRNRLTQAHDSLQGERGQRFGAESRGSK